MFGLKLLFTEHVPEPSVVQEAPPEPPLPQLPFTSTPDEGACPALWAVIITVAVHFLPPDEDPSNAPT